MVTLTRRGLLARAGQLAPLAAAAGMFGRFSVPIAQPIEQEILPDAVPMQEAMVGWVGAEPVYDQASFFSTEEGWMMRGLGQLWSEAQALGQRIEGGSSILIRSAKDGGVFRWGVGIDSNVSSALTRLFTPVTHLR